jgi:hypothetical protein
MKIKVIILAVMLSFCTVACDSGENPGEEYIPAALENGFIFLGGFSDDPASTYFAAYRSDRTDFPIDGVTLTFSFGNLFADNGHGYGDDAEVYIKVFFSTGTYYNLQYNDIKEIDDFYREEYNCSLVKIDEARKKVVFNHSEDITIPEKLFTGERGEFAFAIRKYIVLDNGREPTYGSGSAVAIYYKVTGQTVRLSSAEITD